MARYLEKNPSITWTTTTSSTGGQPYYINYPYNVGIDYDTITIPSVWTWEGTTGEEDSMKTKELIDSLEKEAFRVCPECEGDKKVFELADGDAEVYKKVKCPRCKGKGNVLTQEGIALKKLLERLVSIVVEDCDCDESCEC